MHVATRKASKVLSLRRWIGKSALGADERYTIARERETPEQREERLRRNRDYITVYETSKSCNDTRTKADKAELLLLQSLQPIESLPQKSLYTSFGV